MTVLEVDKRRHWTVIVCEEIGGKEAFILTLGKDVVAAAGDRGTITFKEGGITGGYWDYSA